MRKLFLGTMAAAMLVSGAAMADAIADRKAVMKEKVGASMGVLVKTVKGEMVYDAAAVKAAFTTMREGTANFANLFPEGSESGGKTIADPKIWSDMDGFKAALAKFHADLDEAIAANPADKDAYGPVFGKVAANCNACHETYRVPQ